MDYEKIKTFITIAECGTITEAAERLYVTQPALTYQVKALEQELGAKLLERGKGSHQTTLTPAGEAFVGLARKLLDQWDQLRGTIELMANQDRISVGSMISIAGFVLDEFCERFTKQYPDGNLYTHFQTTDALYDAINAGKFDIGITYRPNTTETVRYVPIANEPYVFVCRKDSNYPDTIHVADLNPRKEIFHFWSPEYNLWHDKVFGVNGHYVETAGSVLHLKYFFGGYRDWTIMPASVYHGLGEDFRTCTCNQLPSKRRIYAMWEEETDREEMYEGIAEMLRESLAQTDSCFEIIR